MSHSNPTRRVVDVLVAVNSRPDGISLTEVARVSSIAVATCTAILSELVAAGVVGRGMDRRYRPLVDGSPVPAPAGVGCPVVEACSVKVPDLQRRTSMGVSLVRIAPEGLELAAAWTPDGTMTRTRLLLFPSRPPFGLTAIAWVGRRRAAAWLDSGPCSEEERRRWLGLMADLRRERYVAWQSSGLQTVVDRQESTLDQLERQRTADWSRPLLEHRTSVDAMGYTAVPSRTFKSNERLDIAMIVAPVFGAGPVPTHQLELQVLSSATTRARRLMLAAALGETAEAVSLALSP